MTSRFTHWTIRFFIIILIGLVIPAQIGQAQSTDYPVVDTGQTVCYDSNGIAATCPTEGNSLYGQDAQHTGNAPSFTNNGNGTVTDNVTGMMWQNSANTDGDGDIDAADKLTYSGAQTYCDNLSLASYTDWRLPDIKQLYSLIDFSGRDPSGYEGSDTSGLVPFIDTDYFEFAYGDADADERIIDAQYASSTLYVGNGGSSMFGVNFADGRIKGYGVGQGGMGKTFFVICARGNTSYGQNDLASNGDSTITDSATGLMWAQNDSGSGLNWEEALAWVEQKNAASYLGHDDWRLPNAKELQSIVDYSRSPDTTSSAAIDPLFNATAITNEAGAADYPTYWSSTTHANWSEHPGNFGAYVAFGRAMGYMNGSWIDVHGAGAQRSDPKSGDPDDYPTGHGPQGDAIRIYNYVRLVRDAGSDPVVPPTEYEYEVYLPLISNDHTASSGSSSGGSSGGGSNPTADDYNLFAPLGDTTTYLIDEAGNSAFTWDSNYRPGNAVYLLEDGNLLRTGKTQSSNFEAGGAGGIVEEIAPDSTVVWSFEYSTNQVRLHHDIEPLPNGNVLMIAWEMKTEAQATAAGRDPAQISDGELWPDTIIEVNPETDTIVWEWHVWDHLIQDYDNTKDNYGVVADHPELIDLNYSGPGNPPGSADWNHTNSIDYNSEFDQILVSVRSFSEIWIIDHSTTTGQAAGHTGGDSAMGGDLLYRWGNPQAHDAGNTSDQQLFVQHDAQWIPTGYPGEGNILIFNNGLERVGRGYSSVDEIVPPVNDSGQYTSYGPSAPVWTYTASTPTDLYATNISGAQRLPDGNTLICDGPDGYFFEVTPADDIVWEYDSADKAFRVTRYTSDYAGMPGVSDLQTDANQTIHTAEPNLAVQQLEPQAYLPLFASGRSSTDSSAFTIDQTLSDGAQRNTIAFDALAFLTGDLGSDSFFPPGKVADFWGFQYLRDNDPTEMGHNTDFLTSAAFNMLTTLTSAQRVELIALAEGQVDDINQYGYDRFVLIKAFRRLLENDLPAGSTGLDETAVKAYSADLYRLDGEISYERAQVMGGMLSALDAGQRAYLDAMVGTGMLTWPDVDEPAELQGLEHDVKVAVMTYAGDMFSWYAGSVDADVYFCPERQGTYFGSFYMKDAPAVGNPGYTIPSNLTADLGDAFLDTLTTAQSPTITDLVDEQKPALYAIVDRREDVATLLRQFMSGGTPDQATVLALMEQYGELDGEIIYRYATAFVQVNQALTAAQQTALMTLRTDLLGDLSFPDGAYLYSDSIAIPDIANTDFLFAP